MITTPSISSQRRLKSGDDTGWMLRFETMVVGKNKVDGKSHDMSSITASVRCMRLIHSDLSCGESKLRTALRTSVG